jgi:hypothetical protein
MAAYQVPFLSKSEVAIYLAYTNVSCRLLVFSIAILSKYSDLNLKMVISKKAPNNGKWNIMD